VPEVMVGGEVCFHGVVMRDWAASRKSFVLVSGRSF
jgi:hypothetical protein